ncbi:uncharacterized protein LOC133181407 [Saccostrea echinata]|uniref:uncharacterized protein LOC133181407 n=1 Tax=Saccostrea echinata TaxID=191078 RepID=UPI002A825E74|nr:uncharacterized protein LOC133181407 [Saccostrea echinata]
MSSARMNYSGFFGVTLYLAATICITLAQLECARYPLCADSMFKKPIVIETRFNNSFIESVKLLERYSYYKCEPKEEKYGIGADSKEWWVFKGCGGVFEVKECAEEANVALQQKPKEMIKNHHREIDRKCRVGLGLEKPEKVSESF